MTDVKQPRKKSAKSSDPKIRALGWEGLSPESLIDKTIERFRQATDAAKELAAKELADHQTDPLPSR